MIQLLSKMTEKHTLNQVRIGLHFMGMIGLCVIGSLFYYGVHVPLENGGEQLVTSKLSLEKFLETEDQIRSDNRETNELLSDRKKYLDELLQRIPSKANEDTFLAQLSKIARESGVVIKNFSPGNPVMMQRHARLDIDISANASYEGICHFLNCVAKMPRLCQITSFDVDSSLSPTNQYQFRAKLRIFYAPTGLISVNNPEGGSDARS